MKRHSVARLTLYAVCGRSLFFVISWKQASNG